jgi:PAS domain-containing protein
LAAACWDPGAVLFEWFLCASEPNHGSFGRPADELNRQHDELQKQHIISEAALENMPVGLSMFDEHDRLIVCNPRFLDLYNLPSSEICRQQLQADHRNRTSGGQPPRTQR